MSANLKSYAISLLLVPLILSIGLAPALPFVAAQNEITQCSSDQVLVKRYSDESLHCLEPLTAQIWDTYGTGKIVDTATLSEEQSSEQKISNISKKTIFHVYKKVLWLR